MIAPGATIAEGQAVMELETDKAVVEVPSSVSGTIKDVLVKQGEKIKVGQVIFTVENGAGGKRAEAKASSAPAAAIRPEAKPANAGLVKEPSPAKPAASAAPVTTATPPVVPSETSEATEFKLPELGENIHQGDLVRLMISPGAHVSEGQPVMELETDKAVVEVPSSVTGIVKDVQVSQGDKIKAGQVIFTLEPGATSQSTSQRPSRAEDVHDHARAAFQAVIQSEGKTEEQALPPDQPQAAPVTTFSMPLHLDRATGVEQRGPVPAAPHVRRLARELGIDIHNVPGNGPGGRISENDVKLYAKSMITAAPGAGPPSTHVKQPALPDFSKWRKIERVPMRGV